MFQKAKWIWLQQAEQEDEYASFIQEFSYGFGKVALRICSEINYIAYVNGKRVGFGQFPNYLNEKYVDELDITRYCQPGNNTLRLSVRYEGINTSTHIKDKAGVIFEVTEDGVVTGYSSEHTLSGYDLAYRQHVCRLITKQVGYSVNMAKSSNEVCYKPSREVALSTDFVYRPVEKLVIGDTVYGVPLDIEGKQIYDFGEEIAGYLVLDVECEKDTCIKTAFGEHLVDGAVRQLIGERDFSFDFQCTAGDNHFELLFFRMAGRYIELKNCEAVSQIQIGIMPANYPVKEKEHSLDFYLDGKIYEMCLRTLKLCMHEHYEDCPWREQALYVLDSRNQMLAGYYAFGNYEFARANIVYMAKGRTPDGLLELTYPAVGTPAIPFFSLMYPVVVNEYIMHTRDQTVLNEVMDVVDSIMQVFSSRIDETGLIANFPKPYWNFYEWSEGSDGSEITTPNGTRLLDNVENQYDLILNCGFIYASRHYEALCRILGRKSGIKHHAMKKAIVRNFYDKKKGCYYLSNKGARTYSQLGNAFAKLIGLPGEKLDAAVRGEGDVVPATLSMNGFIFDALLMDGMWMKNVVLDMIREQYSSMLEKGATTCWETLEGESAFGKAGSLCHGWSALPIYYYHILKD